MVTAHQISKSVAHGFSKGNASGLQIKQLKNVLKKLKEADPSKEEMIANIAVQTDGFSAIMYR